MFQVYTHVNAGFLWSYTSPYFFHMIFKYFHIFPISFPTVRNLLLASFQSSTRVSPNLARMEASVSRMWQIWPLLCVSASVDSPELRVKSVDDIFVTFCCFFLINFFLLFLLLIMKYIILFPASVNDMHLSSYRSKPILAITFLCLFMLFNADCLSNCWILKTCNLKKKPSLP